ncbi:MAG: NADH:flavin oxidoreductase [bacterium]|jgi:NADPH2 dehydrogenase
MANLLTPLECRGMRLMNRIVMPPMANNLAAETGEVTDAMVAHYATRAKASVGLVIVEHSFVLPGGRAHPKQPAVDRDELVPGLRRLAQAIRQAGATVAVQITHAGSKTTAETIGTTPAGASPVPHPKLESGEIPREMTREEIKEIVAAFAAAAVRVKEAGFEAVEIHGAHGYLLNQFYSPLTNYRTDDYGGSREKRLKLPLAVVASVREAVGTYPILYRLGADDLMPSGLNVSDAVYAAPRLADAGVDMLDISGGLGGYRPANAEKGYFVNLSAAVKAAVRIPVIVTGGISEAQYANRIIRENKADLVGIGRALLADPYWARKAATELEWERPQK